MLELYGQYSRLEIRNLFAPEEPFTLGSGKWGQQGTIEDPNRRGDWIFFVSYGRQQGDHIFNEGITQDGVLTWQTPPAKTLARPSVQSWIHHDEDINTIGLFLRTQNSGPYTYLGRLQYLVHDNQRETPVHFQWQILDWNLPEEIRARMGLVLHPQAGMAPMPPQQEFAENNGLNVTLPPEPKHRNGVGEEAFRRGRIADYGAQDAKNRALGLAGELAVLEHERARLLGQQINNITDKLIHSSVVVGDGLGYDIKSQDAHGNVIYIEVKTTRGPKPTDFYISAAELAFSQEAGDSYRLYRIYNFDLVTGTGDMYQLTGDLRNSVQLTPIAYRAGP